MKDGFEDKKVAVENYERTIAVEKIENGYVIAAVYFQKETVGSGYGPFKRIVRTFAYDNLDSVTSFIRTYMSMSPVFLKR